MIFPLPQADATRLELRAGAMVEGVPYAAVADTTLDPKSEVELGGQDTLESGDGRSILIKFGDLARYVRGRRVVSATLMLVGGGDSPELVRAGRVNADWAEGPINSVARLLANRRDPDKASKPTPWATTHRARHAGAIDWQAPGARGAGDVTALNGVTARFEGDITLVEGLGPAIARASQRPESDNGLLLEFAKASGFASSQARSGRPTLLLTLEPAPAATGRNLRLESLVPRNGQWVARVRNAGTKAEPAATVLWTRDGRDAGTSPVSALGPNETTSVTLADVGPANADERRGKVVARLALTNPDDDPSDDGLAGYPGAPTVAFDGAGASAGRDIVMAFNETYAPFSRYSFASEGLLRRVNLGDKDEAGAVRVSPSDANVPTGVNALARAMGAPDLRPLNVTPYEDMFAGAEGGDTRDDSNIAPGLGLPLGGYLGPTMIQAPPVPSMLLSMSAVAALARPVADRAKPLPIPQVTLLRLVNGQGLPLKDQELSIRRLDLSGKPLDTLPPIRTSPNGVLSLPAITFEGAGAVVVSAERGKTKAELALKRWQLADATARGATSAAVLEGRLDLPAFGLNVDADLAAGKLVTDSANRLPDVLAPLTDPTSTTKVQLDFKPGDWLEIDLGRDRVMGAIDLLVDDPSTLTVFDLVGYGTGVRPDENSPLAQERDFPLTRRNRGLKDGIVRYAPNPIQIRFVRLVARSEGSLTLRGIRVRPIEQ